MNLRSLVRRDQARDATARARAFAVALLVAGSLLPGAIPVIAAEPVEVVFAYTGSEQTFDVPAKVSTIHVVLIGGKGGDLYDFTLLTEGGRGARIEADLAVEPGTRLYVEVGGSNGPIFNGGGAGIMPGGGASDIREISRTAAGTLDSRLIVAAGGGGASLSYHGPDAGQSGPGPMSGGAGTATGGGSGGTGDYPGQAGSFGVGGNAGLDEYSSYMGGGGGGGYYGGGAGGGSYGETQQESGAGGGGSSYTGSATNASETLDDSGVSSITITYEAPPPDTGVVDADVTVPTSAACIELSTSSVTFGTQRFGTEDVAATPGITLTNCSGNDEVLLARGTDASGDGATWNLVDEAGSCGAATLATDDYHLKLRRDDTQDVTRLAHDNKTIRPLAAGEDGSLDALIDMPCPGSSGAGQTMAMQIVFLVTE